MATVAPQVDAGEAHAPAEPPVFYFDLGSPYAWLAAERNGDIFPVAPTWVPVLLGAIFRARDRSSGD